MALNKNIIKKVKQKTEGDIAMDKFLMSLIEYEGEQHGWYKDYYTEVLENTCVISGDKNNADN